MLKNGKEIVNLVMFNMKHTMINSYNAKNQQPHAEIVAHFCTLYNRTLQFHLYSRSDLHGFWSILTMI